VKNYFDEDIAPDYDKSSWPMFEPQFLDPVVDLLADLARKSEPATALELGVGTGRVALPLSRAGVAIHGIELSEAMVAQLRKKAGAEDIEVTIGDFASARVDATFGLAYLVFNTIMNLTTQSAQVACFKNVAAHLRPCGRFVVEVMTPELQSLVPGEKFRTNSVSPTHLCIDEYDVANQGLVSHHYRFRDGVGGVHSIPFRYVWPAELDLMAQIAGMVLENRWGGWSREPFTERSKSHVSVWRRD
jgi:SAM-dependent methyltransferase